MADVIERSTHFHDDGHASFRARRRDGEEWEVAWSCTGAAHAAAVARGNVQALRQMDSFAAALRLVDDAQAGRGGGRLVVWFDSEDGGNIRHAYDYNLPSPVATAEDSGD